MRNNIYDEELIIQLYRDGKNTVEIANQLGTYSTTIRRILIRNNVKLVSTSERLRIVNNNPFNICLEESDYFLGLLIADGCISKNTITLGLQEQDVYMLERFAKFCSNNLQVYKYFHRKHNKYQYQVSFRNKEICDWLQSKANFINKSNECEIFTELNWNILRGLSDGDGCFFHYNDSKNLGWDFANGSKKFCLQVMEFLDKQDIKSSLSYNHCFHIKSYKDSYKLGQLMYSSNSGLFLKRKYDKWAHCMATYRKNNTLNSGKLSEQ